MRQSRGRPDAGLFIRSTGVGAVGGGSGNLRVYLSGVDLALRREAG